MQIVRRALEFPTRQLADNAGQEGPLIAQEVKKRSGNEGLNVATGKYEDLVKAGVVDPTKVVRTACLPQTDFGFRQTREPAGRLQADGVSLSDAIGRKIAQAGQSAGEVLINRDDPKDIQSTQPLPTIPLDPLEFQATVQRARDGALHPRGDSRSIAGRP